MSAFSSNISRGNGPLSGSDPSDISGAEKISALLQSREEITIERCGEEEEVDCGSIIVELYGVMGQEDYYRQEEGDRVFNYGRGRIVISTNVETNIDLEYKRNPTNISDPSFDSSKSEASVEQKHHEFFFSVAPDTLYAFRVNAQSVDCPDTDKWSGIYYFKTANVVKIDTQNQLETEPTLLLLPLKEYCQNTSTGTSSFAGIAPVWYASNKSTTHILSTNANIVSMMSRESSFSTNYTIQ